MNHRATQLILPFEPALPGRQLILAPRLWPMMTPTTQQQLAKRVAQLLRSMLATADAGDLIGGHHDKYAAQFGKPGDDGASKRLPPSVPSRLTHRFLPPLALVTLDRVRARGDRLHQRVNSRRGATAADCNRRFLFLSLSGSGDAAGPSPDRREPCRTGPGSPAREHRYWCHRSLQNR
jgi:hypothetical protein